MPSLTPKLQALREVEEWQRWANIGIQEQLCEKMEALKSEENPEEIAQRIRDLQQQWRQAADVPRAQSDALWQRFKKAHDEVWARCEAHFAAEAVTRAENLQKKIASLRTGRGARRFHPLDSDGRQHQSPPGRMENDRARVAWPGKGRVGTVSRRLRPFLLEASRRSHQAEGGVGGELRQEGSVVRPGRGAGRFDRLGGHGHRDQTIAGGVEDNWRSQEKPIGDDLAAVPYRLRSVLCPVRAAARYCPRRTGGRPRSDLRRARGCCFGRLPPMFRRRARRPRNCWPGSDCCGRAGSRRSRPGAWNLRARRSSISASPPHSSGCGQPGPRYSQAPTSTPTRIVSGWKPSSAVSKSSRHPSAGPRRPTTRRCRPRHAWPPCSRRRSPRTPSAARSTRAAVHGPRRKTCGRRRPAGPESVRCRKPARRMLTDRFQRACRAIADAGVGVGAGPGAGVTGGTGRTGGTSKAGAPGGSRQGSRQEPGTQDPLGPDEKTPPSFH